MLKLLTRKLFAQPFRRKKPPSKRVAILVPISLRPILTDDEKISVRHLDSYLGEYDRYLIGSPDASLRLPGFRFKAFPKKFFGSVAAVNHILVAPQFFKEFLDYEYIFIYHLDSLVLSNQMERWCDSGVDYIGAPWIPCEDAPWVKVPRVGNTGFGMMKVESALRVLHSRYHANPASYWLDMLTRNGRYLPAFVKLLRAMQKCLPRARWIRTVVTEWDQMQDPGRFGRNTDFFWSDEAVKYWPDYKVASLEEGLEFAFELAPRKCFEMNGGKMPFGCHAWGRYDRNFWESHLLSSEASSAALARN